MSRAQLINNLWPEEEPSSEAWQQQGKKWLALGEAEQGVMYCEQALALYRGDLSRQVVEKWRRLSD